MNFTGFSNEDFQVFQVPGLDARMEAIKRLVRPKLELLGKHFAPTLSTLTGDEMFYHVAKHARRTKNPPNDTWVAFSSSKRGYKKLPHFQIGLWETHLFIWFAVIHEAPNKDQIGASFQKEISTIRKSIPLHYVWSDDHTKPYAIKSNELSDQKLVQLFERLQFVQKAEVLCGLHIPKEKTVNLNGTDLLSIIEDVFVHVIPLYKLSLRQIAISPDNSTAHL
ncbi:MAG: DUF1054 domain-containing protein [Bacillales bacterium]|nr:DUF1054 domain-containing protein [Bacillales bacterium]